MRTLVGHVDELAPGTMKKASLGGKPIVVANVGNRFYAFQDSCLHYQVRLSEGVLEGPVVTCRWHQWQYRVDTGEVLSDESEYETFTTFPTVVEDDELYVLHEPATRIVRRKEDQ